MNITDPVRLLALGLVLGIAGRRLTRLIALDSILTTWRTRFFARFPPAHVPLEPDFRLFRWFPDSTFAGMPEADRPPLRGRLHGRRGAWVIVEQEVPELQPHPDGGLFLPVIVWDETHEGTPGRSKYPLRPVSWGGTLVRCPWCLSVWFVTLLAGFVKLVEQDTPWAPLGLAALVGMWVAGMAALVEDKLG